MFEQLFEFDHGSYYFIIGVLTSVATLYIFKKLPFMQKESMQHLEEAYDRMLGRHPKKPSKFNSPTFWLDHIRSRPLWRLSYEKHLEDLAPVMREEFETLKTVIQPSEYRGGWDAYKLLDEGKWVEEACEACPQTSTLLKSLPICDSALSYVYFSLMAPGTVVEPHRGVSNAKIRCHVGLDVPNDSCFIDVDGKKKFWKNNKSFSFDDTFVHYVRNDSSQSRLILLIDFWHPDLSEAERKFIREKF